MSKNRNIDKTIEKKLEGKTIEDVTNWGDAISIKFSDKTELLIADASGEYNLTIKLLDAREFI